MKEFLILYDQIHIAGYYRGLIHDIKIVNELIERIKEFIIKIEKLKLNMSVGEMAKIKGGDKMKKGFTLIEILIVLAVIGVLAAALMVRAVNLGPDAKNKRAENDLRLIKLAVEAYVADEGKLPAYANSSDDLENALVNASKRLIDYIPNDPWGTGKYKYKTDGGNPPTYYVIYSVGKNGAEEITGVSASSGGEVQASDTTDDIWVSNCRKKNSNMP